jgi:hypothetical protein
VECLFTEGRAVYLSELVCKCAYAHVYHLPLFIRTQETKKMQENVFFVDLHDGSVKLRT